MAIIEYADFQCPYCGVFSKETLPKLHTTYLGTGKALFAFRHLPLPSLHPSATKAAEAAECAFRQDKFWPMHDRLFASPKDMREEDFRAYAKSMDLDLSSFGACLSGQASDRIKADAENARRLGIRGTPTFLLGTVNGDGRVKVTARLAGAAPFERFEQEIEKLLAGAYDQ